VSRLLRSASMLLCLAELSTNSELCNGHETISDSEPTETWVDTKDTRWPEVMMKVRNIKTIYFNSGKFTFHNIFNFLCSTATFALLLSSIFDWSEGCVSTTNTFQYSSTIIKFLRLNLSNTRKIYYSRKYWKLLMNNNYRICFSWSNSKHEVYGSWNLNTFEMIWGLMFWIL